MYNFYYKLSLGVFYVKFLWLLEYFEIDDFKFIKFICHYTYNIIFCLD